MSRDEATATLALHSWIRHREERVYDISANLCVGEVESTEE